MATCLINRLTAYRANKGQAEDAKAPSAGAKSLCIPFDQKRFGEFPDGDEQKCIQCGKKARSWTMFGRSESSYLDAVSMEWLMQF